MLGGNIKKIKNYLEVLRAFEDLDKWYTIKEIQEKLKVSYEPAHRHLNSLVKENHLLRKKIGKKTYYKVNKKNKLTLKSLEISGVKPRKLDMRLLLPIATLIIIISILLLPIKVSELEGMLGFIPYEQNVLFFEDKVSIKADATKYYTWIPNEKIENATLSSIKISGILKGDVNVYLETNKTRILILNSSKVKASYGNITGYVIKEVKKKTSAAPQIKKTIKEQKVQQSQIIEKIAFSEVCEESCDISKYNLSSNQYKLYFEINGDSEIEITKIHYSYLLKKEKQQKEESLYTKIKDAKTFDVVVDSAEIKDNNLVIVFEHNSTNDEQFFVIGNVTYGFTKNPAPPNENVTLTIYNWNYEYFELQVGEKNPEAFAFGNKQVENETLVVRDSKGNKINADIVIEGEKKFSVSNVKKGFNITIVPKDKHIKRIRLINARLKKLLPKEIIVVDKPKNKHGFNNVYVIIPSKDVVFDKAEIIAVAEGDTLYKCKNWDSQKEECIDPCGNTKCNTPKWEKVMSLTPGEEYKYVMSYTDPAFAEYNSSTGAPRCATSESPCIANSSLLKSRDNLATPEPNAPNTIDNCVDGTSGVYQSDESVENITITDLNNSKFNGGDTVRVDAWVYCYDSISDNINIVYTNNTENPKWRVVASVNPCPSAGFNKISKTFVLDDVAGYHTVRVIIQYLGSTSDTCGFGNYDDNDDISFYVISSNQPPETFFFEDFESGSFSTNNWTTYGGVSSNWVVSTIIPYEGTYHAGASNTDGNSYLENSINTKEYTSITLSYYRFLKGIDVPDEFKAEWYNGSAWITLEETNGNTENDASYVYKTFNLPSSAWNNPNFKIRFLCKVNGKNEGCSLDNIRLSGKDTYPPSITIESPTNTTYTTSDVWLNISATDRNNVDSCWYSLDNGQNISMTKDTPTHFSKKVILSDGSHNVIFYCNDTKGNINSTSKVYFTVDATPPKWSNQFQNASAISQGESILLGAKWTDTVGLSTAILSTNETGVWENKTIYESPKLLNGKVDWSNFTWKNPSIPSGTTVAWKIYANDTSNKWNVTDTKTFQIISTCVISLSTNSIDFGTVNAGADTGSANQQVNITNTGNTQATSTTIKGTDWSDGGVNSFAVGNTEWSTSAFTYGSGTDLTTTDATIPGGNLNPGS
ncbi:MAG: hypothetical protein J7K22_02950, partial [Nanoarchaeota archaeon]|nr:hypothetical protein [Nanoarchaeota archaeon]